jgi:hypothetical protein
MKTVSGPESNVNCPAAYSKVGDAESAQLSEMMVGDALAAEAAKSRITHAKVFSLPLNTFFSHSKNKKINDALIYKNSSLSQREAVIKNRQNYLGDIPSRTENN